MATKKKTTTATPRRISVRIAGLPGGKNRKLSPALTLVSKTAPLRTYVICPGVPVPVEPGIYSVCGSYTPMEEGKVQGGSVYASPAFVVDGEITVKDDVKSYLVEARYTCFALVIDTTVCEKYRIRGYAGAMMDMPWLFGPDPRKVAFLSGRWDFPGLDIEAGNAAFSLVNSDRFAGKDSLLVKNGCWYSFNPAGEVVSGEIKDLL